MTLFHKSLILTLFAMVLIRDPLQAQMTPFEAVSLMKHGINLGNTLEPPHESDWNNPPAQEVYFDRYLEAGFDVVRVPVRWDNHTAAVSPFRITEEWMNRVEEVVDWGLSRGLFIVINAHHDNWIKDNYADPVARARFDSIWSQLAVRFKDKPEKLIFEILNEPHGLTKDQNNEMHARIVGIIRKTNPTRNVIIQGHNWGGSTELMEMAIPDDDYLIGSFHSYDPWPFGLEGTGTFGSPYQLQTLEKKFSDVKEWSDEHHIPVFLGEFACHNGADYNSRMKHYRAYVNFSQKYGFTSCAWDDGGNFQVMLRSAGTWNEIKDILIYCSPESPTITSLSIYQDSLVNLRWNPGAGGFDTIFIQRKISTAPFKTIAALSGDSEAWFDNPLTEGREYDYRIVGHYPDGTVAHSNPLRIYLPVYSPKIRSYYLGSPLVIPGDIEAENFDSGGEGLTYHDLDDVNTGGAYRPGEGVDIFDINGKGYHIGNAAPGEWLEYTVEVEEAGEYLVALHFASIYRGGKFVLKVGETTSDTLETFRTGSWLNTDKVTFSMNLNKGMQVMRLTVTDPELFNIDKISFVLNTSGFNPYLSAIGFYVTQDASGDLFVTSNKDAPLNRLELIDISGALVGSVMHPDPVQRISTNGLVPGIYLIRGWIGDRMIHKKIMLK